MAEHDDIKTSDRYSRGRFLGTVGAGAIAIGTSGAVRVGTARAAAPAATPARHVAPALTTHFGRIFDRMPPFADLGSHGLEAALVELGSAGGVLDARDALQRGPVQLIADPSLSAHNPDNPTHTAGTTFMGQFMDHDMTFDTSSPLGKPVSPRATRNGRTPSFDLDSVYGAGPVGSPQLYDPADRAKLKVESGGLFEDVPRMADGTAIIADPRNDENVVISGLQAAFLRFHNNAVDRLRAGGTTDQLDVYTQARRLTTWHYQWLILHEFLPQFVGQSQVNAILRRGRRFYRTRKGEAFIPVEFQGAAYRFGHSMVRPSYRANLAGDNGKPFFGLIFDHSLSGRDPADLRGGSRAPRRFIGWQTFFDFEDGQVKRNKRIDTKISTPLFNLPISAIASHSGPTVLPVRTLLRHVTWELPSGQTLAHRMGVTPLGAEDLNELKSLGHRLERSTPLWYYVLKEAELIEDGLHLGPVGGRIVGEVIVGLLQSDTESYLSYDPRWRPTLPGRSRGDFDMVDFLTFAGVDPKSRGQ
jgi:Animal haem peroxidase